MNDCLKKIPYLSLLSRIARRRSLGLWLVGGFLRDHYLKENKGLAGQSGNANAKQKIDFDFCLERDTLAFVKEFSNCLDRRYIVLDSQEESFRVIVQKKNMVYQFDFSRMRGKTLEEDLLLRDFTFNTLAFAVHKRTGRITDICGAVKDISKAIVRVTQERVIKDDPLRILRGFAFSARLGFRIEKNTLLIFSRYKKLLSRVSFERLSEELYKLFSSPCSYKTVKLMDSAAILDCLIPEIRPMRGLVQGDYHHLDVWAHSIETLRQFELLYARKFSQDKDIREHLSAEIAGGRSRLQIIKLACLLHDVGKPRAKKKLRKKTIFYEHEKIGRDIAAKLADKLRLSGKEKDLLKKLVFWHLRPGYLADQIKPTRRAVYHFFRDTQEEGAAVIALSLSDWRATRGPLTSTAKRRRHEKIMLGLLKEYIAHKKAKPLKKIIDGNDIMRYLHIKSGPLVGAILKKIGEEQALGHISAKTAALAAARQYFNQIKKEEDET